MLARTSQRFSRTFSRDMWIEAIKSSCNRTGLRDIRRFFHTGRFYINVADVYRSID